MFSFICPVVRPHLIFSRPKCSVAVWCIRLAWRLPACLMHFPQTTHSGDEDDVGRGDIQTASWANVRKSEEEEEEENTEHSMWSTDNFMQYSGNMCVVFLSSSVSRISSQSVSQSVSKERGGASGCPRWNIFLLDAGNSSIPCPCHSKAMYPTTNTGRRPPPVKCMGLRQGGFEHVFQRQNRPPFSHAKVGGGG